MGQEAPNERAGARCGMRSRLPAAPPGRIGGSAAQGPAQAPGAGYVITPMPDLAG